MVSPHTREHVFYAHDAPHGLLRERADADDISKAQDAIHIALLKFRKHGIESRDIVVDIRDHANFHGILLQMQNGLFLLGENIQQNG
jgi:hypothetical protein